MELVSIDRDDCNGLEVETIGLWYSDRRRSWFVERLDRNGDQIGLAHRCHDEQEASACLGEWLRAHGQAYVEAPHALTTAERRVLARGTTRRRAA